MSFRRLIPAIVLLAVFAMASRVSTDGDSYWHLRAGAWMVEHRQLLDHDPFSLTRMGEPWVYPGWLAQLLLYGAYALMGFAGLNLLTAAMVLVAFLFLWNALEARPLMRAFVLVLAVMTSAVYWSARPQIFSFALAGAFLFLLEWARAGRWRGLWALPPLMALWVNLHGGFAIGFLLLGVYLAGEAVEAGLEAVLGRTAWRLVWQSRRSAITRLGIVGLVCALAVFLNPHGPVMLLYPFKTVSIGVLQDYIQEWQSPDFHRGEVQPFLWMLLLLLAAFGTSGKRARASELVGVAVFGFLALMAGRNIALFALVAAPALARHGEAALAPLLERFGRSRQIPERIARRINLVVLILAALAAAAKVLIAMDPDTNQAAQRSRLPIAAVEYIQESAAAGPLFNSYNWGGYVVWALYPKYPSFVDGRTDLFDDAILSEYLDTWRALEGWEATLQHWGIRLVLIEPEAPLAGALERAGWNRLYADDQAVVLASPALD